MSACTMPIADAAREVARDPRPHVSPIAAAVQGALGLKSEVAAQRRIDRALEVMFAMPSRGATAPAETYLQDLRTRLQTEWAIHDPLPYSIELLLAAFGLDQTEDRALAAVLVDDSDANLAALEHALVKDTTAKHEVLRMVRTERARRRYARPARRARCV